MYSITQLVPDKWPMGIVSQTKSVNDYYAEMRKKRRLEREEYRRLRVEQELPNMQPSPNKAGKVIPIFLDGNMVHVTNCGTKEFDRKYTFRRKFKLKQVGAYSYIHLVDDNDKVFYIAAQELVNALLIVDVVGNAIEAEWGFVKKGYRVSLRAVNP